MLQQEISRRIRRRRRTPGEDARDVGLSVKEETRRVMLAVTDRLLVEIRERSSRIEELRNRSNFLIVLHKIQLTEDDAQEQLRKDCLDFAQYYPNDICASELFSDLTDFIQLKQPLPVEPCEKLSALVGYGKETFPAACIAYRLLLTLPISVASCERSFSKLKLIKTYLRSTMSQERLSSLAMLSIEHGYINQNIKDQVTRDFVQRRQRIGFRNH
jgi:hypothetical protein